MIRLVWLFASTLLVTKSLVNAVLFRPLTTANGSTLCAVGDSTFTEAVSKLNIDGIPIGVPDVVTCSYRCTDMNANDGCTAFNYVKNGSNGKECHFYPDRPSRCVVSSPGCLYYEVDSNNAKPTAPTCSFPFTYKGQLYNKCIPVGNSPSVDWYCYSLDSSRISCSHADNDYENYVNVAVNRKAFQVSTYDSHVAAFAVNNNTWGMISCTLYFIQPWWAVDLGAPSNVIAVNVTNDMNVNQPERLDNFLVWLSTYEPAVGQPLNTPYFTLCAQYNGRVPVSATVLMSCYNALGVSTFRYVIIQSSLTSSNAICLTHVEVYIGFTDQVTMVNVTVPVMTKSVYLKKVNSWLVILSRVDGNFSYNSTWTTYRDGFGNLSSNFWLGFESLYQLTSELFRASCGHFYRLRFELQSAASGRWYSEEYDWFYVDGELNSYALHVPTSCAGDAGDALNSPTNNVNGMKFYSYDKDTSNHCAAAHGVGWWNSRCSSSNVMGSPNDGFVWNELVTVVEESANNGGGKLSTARMMIKAVG